jgi:hypothetical protein
MKQAAVRKSTEILLLALRRLGLSVLVLVAAFISTASLKLIRRAGATHHSSLQKFGQKKRISTLSSSVVVLLTASCFISNTPLDVHVTECMSSSIIFWEH